MFSGCARFRTYYTLCKIQLSTKVTRTVGKIYAFTTLLTPKTDITGIQRSNYKSLLEQKDPVLNFNI